MWRGLLDDEIQLVTVNGRWGYAWDPERKIRDPETGAARVVFYFLHVDEIVVCPGAGRRPQWYGRVTALGSTWDKQFKHVIRPATTAETLAFVRDEITRKRKAAAKAAKKGT